ncbi:hypothetical protein AB9Q10_13350 [Streptomyces krungchingensis]|uniref:hypothetical protein n=1 Tax=Streptomyces krungchingensis TaxID=1565034 RepID=UPI003CE67997
MDEQQRYHLTLSAGDKPVMYGWWPDLATAERKFTSWIGEHGSVDGARIVLTELGESGHTQMLKQWPSDA